MLIYPEPLESDSISIFNFLFIQIQIMVWKFRSCKWKSKRAIMFWRTSLDQRITWKNEEGRAWGVECAARGGPHMVPTMKMSVRRAQYRAEIRWHYTAQSKNMQNNSEVGESWKHELWPVATAVLPRYLLEIWLSLNLLLGIIKWLFFPFGT